MPYLPLVSVCIPAYNASGTLRQTLDSVLAQRYPNIEVIVSDNHSTDTTEQVIRSYAERNVQYCRPGPPPEWQLGSPSYIGIYVNANFVSKQGQGEYICLFHSDDIYDPAIVQELVELMQANPKAGAAFTMQRTIGKDGQLIRMGALQLPPELRGQQWFDFATLFNAVLTHGNFLPTPSVILRRNVLEAVGDFVEQEFRTCADLEMWLRIAQKHPIGVIDKPLLSYRYSQSHASYRYNHLRTTQADFFTVIDYFLAQPAVQSLTTSQALAGYEFQRSVDQIVRATNLFVQGRSAEAQPLLYDAVQPKHFATALQRRSKRLLRLITGAGLLGSSRLGLGTQAAHLLQHAEQQRKEWLHTSIR